MIVTADDMYQHLLQFINKEQTGTLFPDEFEKLINDRQLVWVKNKYFEQEITQKRIDDLQVIKTKDVILNTGAAVSGQEEFLLPYSDTGFVTTPGNPGGDNNGYLLMLNASFKIQYVNNICNLTGESGFLKAKPKKSDTELENELDPYNKPTDSRLYYEIRGNKIFLDTGTDSYGTECRITYLRYPRKITLTPAVNCELSIQTREEIVHLSEKYLLETYESQRYQTSRIQQSDAIN